MTESTIESLMEILIRLNVSKFRSEFGKSNYTQGGQYIADCKISNDARPSHMVISLSYSFFTLFEQRRNFKPHMYAIDEHVFLS